MVDNRNPWDYIETFHLSRILYSLIKLTQFNTLSVSDTQFIWLPLWYFQTLLLDKVVDNLIIPDCPKLPVWRRVIMNKIRYNYFSRSDHHVRPTILRCTIGRRYTINLYMCIVSLFIHWHHHNKTISEISKTRTNDQGSGQTRYCNYGNLSSHGK
jgi:hypothetical protein